MVGPRPPGRCDMLGDALGQLVGLQPANNGLSRCVDARDRDRVPAAPCRADAPGDQPERVPASIQGFDSESPGPAAGQRPHSGLFHPRQVLPEQDIPRGQLLVPLTEPLSLQLGTGPIRLADLLGLRADVHKS